MKASTTLMVDGSVVVTVAEISVDELDGYALTVGTPDRETQLVLAGTHPDLCRVLRDIGEAAGRLDALERRS